MTGSVIVSNTAEKVKVPVGIDSFPLGLSVPFDVYSKSGAGGYSCVIRKWAKFDQAAKDTFKKQGTVFLYIEGDAVKVRQYIENIKTGAPVKPDSGASAYASEKALYHHVSRTLFPAGTEVTFSLFTVDNLRFVPVIAVVDGKAAVITDAVRNSTGDIYIKVPDMPLFREFLSLPSKSVTPQVKATMVKEGVKMSVRDFLSSPSKDQNTDGVVKSANQIIGVLRQKEVALSDLLQRSRGDWHIYNHSNNVAVLSTAIAVAMGAENVEKLSIAAMVHDIGKTLLPPELLGKRDRLTDSEFASWKRHVIDGSQMLQGKGFAVDTVIAVKQHHERLSGNGYPYRLKGMGLSKFGRIISIVDCYDALVTPKAFKPAMTPYNALALISKESKDRGDFDGEMVRLLISILKGQGKI
ncbi:MAG: HD-GYP domain-containing protein [Syntrophobacteraceae bacterium]